MTALGRRLRGAIGIGLTWAVLWLVVGVLLFIVFRIFQPEDIGPGEGPSRVLPILATVGFLSGLAFAFLLSLTEGRRTFRELSLRRVSIWGLLGSAPIPLLMGTDAGMGVVTGSLGAIFAAGSVAIARRGTLKAAHENVLLTTGDTPEG